MHHRKKSHHHRRRHHRRGFLRNPPGGMTGGLVQAAKDGALVVGGQVATRKIVGGVQGAFANVALLQSSMGKVGLSLLASIAATIAARKALPPGAARMLAAGAFAETINCGLAQTPIASYLGAYRPVRLSGGAIGPVSRRNMSGYTGNPSLLRSGVSGYPRAIVPQAVHVGS